MSSLMGQQTVKAGTERTLLPAKNEAVSCAGSRTTKSEDARLLPWLLNQLLLLLLLLLTRGKSC